MENNTAIRIPLSALQNIADAAENLQGEEAVENLMGFVDHPSCDMAGDEALKSVVRFYSNVRYLTGLIKELGIRFE